MRLSTDLVTCMRGLDPPIPYAQLDWHQPLYALRIPTMPSNAYSGVAAASLIIWGSH